MDQSVTVSLATDSEGFMSQECPACAKRFKVVFGGGSDRPIAYCPYCGHAGRDCWWTQAQADYLAAVAGQEIAGPLLDDFARNVNRISRPGDFLNIRAKVDHGRPPSKPKEPELPMAVVEFDCCGERIKHDGTTTTLRCIVCGSPSQCSHVALSGLGEVDPQE